MEIGSPAMRCRKAEACATLMRFRRSAISKALATSKGQMAGVSTSVPAKSRSRTPSAKPALSSSKHQATATDASRTIRLITSPFIDQLADTDLSQSCALSNLANLSYKLIGRLFLTGVGGNKFRDRNPPPRDPDRLALRDSFQKTIEMRLRVEHPDSIFTIHVN